MVATYLGRDESTPHHSCQAHHNQQDDNDPSAAAHEVHRNPYFNWNAVDGGRGRPQGRLFHAMAVGYWMGANKGSGVFDGGVTRRSRPACRRRDVWPTM